MRIHKDDYLFAKVMSPQITSEYEKDNRSICLSYVILSVNTAGYIAAISPS